MCTCVLIMKLSHLKENGFKNPNVLFYFRNKMKSGVLLSSSRLCDKFDRSMAFGKQETDDRTDYWNGDSRKKKHLQPVEWESVAYGSSIEHSRLIIPRSCPMTV